MSSFIFMRQKVKNNRKFAINCEIELFGDPFHSVVTTCPELNIHTVDNSIQGAVNKLAEAINFFFDTAEARFELEPVLDELEKGSLGTPPWLDNN